MALYVPVKCQWYALRDTGGDLSREAEPLTALEANMEGVLTTV